jgi:histidyl-tRNA synthetase
VGANSPLQEIELIQLYDAVFTDLGLKKVAIKLNHRKILSGIAEVIGAQDKLIPFTVALDKLDKIGKDGVIKELLASGISAAAVEMAMPLFVMSNEKSNPLAVLSSFLKNSLAGQQGIAELQFIIENIEKLGLSSAEVMIDVSLARGLNYYTGAIMEVAAPAGVSMGSIGGGGRYDDLTGIFGMKDLSGVGISFGLDRIYLVLEELGLFPETIDQSVQVLFVNFGEKEAMAALPLIRTLREQGIKTDLYPAEAKMQKQFKYANNRNIPFVVLLGKDELEQQTIVVKNMAEGSQKSYSWKELEQFIKIL